VNGILLIDKPSGWTSFDIVAKVRGLLRKLTGSKIKIGHTGTLDPLATGLLVLMVGNYTKKVPEFTKLDKTYEVTMRLGQTSTTGDEEGDKLAISDKVPGINEVREALVPFVGEIEQVPPAYSAVKVGGKRAYDLARAGKTPELKPRQVKIYKLELKKYDYPLVQFAAEVSSGTYIRSLVEDIGKQLGTGAYTSNLRRTRVGNLSVTHAVKPDTLTADKIMNVWH
jgi:tRNA pseudouridine55 synthase